MFGSVLIANRGEIACRVVRTARRLGIRTIAVYSEADAGARHVAMADEAWLIGPAAPAESYLNVKRIRDVVRKTGAESVHPGYGFLAENAAFATAIKRAGAVFIGPPARAIRAMGIKSEAKAIMTRAGVPVVPGYHDEDQSLRVFRREAGRLGYPVLIKASAGGGGRGMRIVEAEGELPDAVAAARREAESAFGDSRLLVEEYIERPRHIEIQVFADSHSNAVHLFERDCSIQRRHQKVVEEAPAPGMTPVRRTQMAAAALAAAKAIGYQGAGTVEFITDMDGAHYFMEMNTRLQVEHPVTEMITGQDLVEWQFRIAAGEPLPCSQDDLVIDGHAIEVRIYAEDPARGFLPASGTLTHLRFPDESSDVRVDTGVDKGDVVSIHYDPMIAKLVVRGDNRAAAARHLSAALAEVQVLGVTTNLAFLRAVAAHGAFLEAETDTGFIERHEAALLPAPGSLPDRCLALACLHMLLRQRAAAAETARRSSDPYSPWHNADGWRLSDEGRQTLRFRQEEAEIAVLVHYRRLGGWLLDLPSGRVEASVALDARGDLVAAFDGERCRATVVEVGRELTVFGAGEPRTLTIDDPLARTRELEAGAGRLTAPMPGRILEVLVSDGARVVRGAPLVVLEAMKMEHTITAPADGRVERVNFKRGEQVDEGAELLVLEAERTGTEKP